LKKRDNSSELEGILEKNAGIIHKLSFVYANSQAEAEDLRQEISYQIVKSFKQFKGESKVSTWIYKVALYTALSHLRVSKKAPPLIHELPETASPDDAYDRWNEVLGEIKKLPPVDRSLIFLYLENKSYAEMADIMGLSESNVGVRLNRAKQKLKEKLG
jgi:RNA polymerase sigma-70 factor (ECF subfamily)